jgi:class 3 adenylate cyclase/tetratricopeptide (TPR) repeat protein
MVEGVFLFGDVSGFTPLSEKLKKQGQQGAERITQIINQLFTQLVAVLFDHGGTLLKFGGDALLGLFPTGNEAELAEGTLRATQAALAMQNVMEQEAFSAIALVEADGRKSEPQALRIKCGISAGRYFAAHIGTKPDAQAGRPSKMAYVTTGHTVNLAEEAEGHANPGEVVITRRAYDLLQNMDVETGAVTKDPDPDFVRITAAPPATTLPNRGSQRGERHTEQPGADSNSRISSLVERLDKLTAYLSEELIARIALNPRNVRLTPDHRPVTVMFVNYLGISDLIEDMGDSHPEIIVAQLNSYFTYMAGVVGKYEGLLARMDQYAVGDRLVVFFGAPHAHEDDPVRAVYTALEMQAATREHFAALQTPVGIYRFRQRIGINTGALFAGNAGAPDLRQEYTLMGDDINMAARLMSYAGWSEIFISNKTEEFVRPYVELGDRFELKVKGKDILIPTYKVLGRRQEVGATRGLDEIDTPMVGRDAALGVLQSSGAMWLKGRGQIAVVNGNSGVGKSRLLREFRGWLGTQKSPADMIWVEARALSFSEHMAYWLAQDFVRGILDLPENANADDLLFTLWDKGETLLGKEKAREAVPFLADMLGVALQGEWARVVAELPPNVRQKETFWAARELFIAAARQAPLVLALDDLHWADEASLALIEDLLTITDQAPVMLLLIFRDRRDLACWELRNTAEARFPHRFKEVALKPLAEAESLGLLNAMLPGAAFGDTICSEILTKAAGNPLYLEELVRSLIETGAVVRHRVNGSVHWEVTAEFDKIAVPDSLRSAIVARIDRLTEDARYALQTAAVIGRQFRLELLQALIEAEAEIDIWLAQLERGDLIRLADLTAASYAFPDAMVQEVAYESLLVQSRAQLHARVGEMLEDVFTGRLDQGCELLAYHFSHSDDENRALDYLRMAAQKARRQYANETAIRHYERMLAIQKRQQDKAAQAGTLYNMGVMAYEIGDYKRARAWLEASVTLLEEAGDDKNAAWSIMYLGMVDLKQGFYGGARHHHQRALDLARARQDAGQEGIHLTNLARVMMRLGEYDEALDTFEKSLLIKKANNDLVGQGFSHFYRGLVYLDLQQPDPARAALEAAHAAWEQVSQNDRVMSYHLAGLGHLSFALGQWETAAGHFRDALAISERLMLSAETIENLSMLSQAELHCGRIESALDTSTRAIMLLASQKDVEEIQRIYLNHYLVLNATEAPDAIAFLQLAREVLAERQGRIADEQSRCNYRERVPVNHAILEIAPHLVAGE